MLQMDTFAFNQIARQPAVDAPQIGQKGDVKHANHPEMRADEQLPPRRAARLLGDLFAGRFALQLHPAQADAHENQHRHRQHRHHKEGALPAKGIEQPNRQRKTNRCADRCPEQPQHGGPRLKPLRKGVADDGERQRKQRSFGNAEQNAQGDHHGVVMGKAHHHH